MSSAIGGSIASTAFSQGSENMWSAFPNVMQIKSFRYQDLANKNKYQWMVNDLRKAGLNPLLVAGGNASATSAPYSSQGGAHSGGNLGASMASAMQAKKALELQEKEKEVMQSQIDLNDELENKAASDSNLQAANADYRYKEKELLQQQIDANLSSAQSLQMNIDLLKKQYEMYRVKAQAEMYKGKLKGQILTWTEWLKGIVSPFVMPYNMQYQPYQGNTNK